MTIHKVVLFLLICLLVSCKKETEKVQNMAEEIPKQFSLISSYDSKVSFTNNVSESLSFNFLNYAYVYTGGGVAAGDINNDGLVDLYFTSNQNENKLYLNKGNFVFEDITQNANVVDKEGWSTGVTMIDINNDGWLDIYVCKSASLGNDHLRKNKLYINQKNNTFKEEAIKWKIDDAGFSIQSYFLDYDKDGDLDMYLVNHREDFRNNTKISKAIQSQISNKTSDQLYRNEGNYFSNVSKQAGILNKAWGLSAAIGDFNNDDWPDVYVCNDYLEPDMLYINNKNGTFTDKVLEQMRHISFSSMGSDFADMNNDLLNDLAVLDMTPSDHVRSKTNMAAMSTENFNAVVRSGYHHQYMFNMLQLNNGNKKFSDIGQLAGISKTDWSWAPLLADFDNDGLKDLFVTNGIVKDMGNRDFKNNLQRLNAEGKVMTLEEVKNMIPEKKVSNYFYQNQGSLKFKNMAKKWGLDQPSYSQGATYADLDNDGDLDIIVNNMNDEAFIYRNNTTNNYIKIELKGPKRNVIAIGSKVIVYSQDQNQMQDLYLGRGYQSSVDNKLHFGLNDRTEIDSIKIVWPDGKISTDKNVKTNQTLVYDYKKAKSENDFRRQRQYLLSKIDNNSLGIDFKHIENEFDDYKEQVLLPYSQSHHGPFMAKADVNGDGLEDFFIGGANGQSGELYIQSSSGSFKKQVSNPFKKDNMFEDLGVLFFDADNDKDQDLYIVSGGAFYKENDKMYQDRLYINDGKGNFTRNINALPKITSSGQTVIANDIDNDGDIDLFVGGRVVPNKYPYAPKSYMLINNNGVFEDKIKEVAPELEFAGMVSKALFSDYDKDGDNDLIVVGEWTEIQFYNNNKGKFNKVNISGLEKTTGLWFGLAEHDIDNDGNMDYFVGNLGLNSKFSAKKGKEFHIFCDDFDQNGTYDIVLSNKYKENLVPVRGRECSSEQMPFVSEKYPNFQLFAEADLNDIIGSDKLEKALHYQVDMLYSIFLKNKGNGEFEIVKLPNYAQIGPILDFDFIDVNKDDHKEVITIGNIYNAEVETQRYDASYGNVLEFKDNKFTTINTMDSGLSTSSNTKDIEVIRSEGEEKYLLITNNNDQVDIFKIN